MTTLRDHLPYAIRQFEVDVVVPLKVFGLDVSITSVSTAKVTTAFLIVTYMIYAMRQRAILPGRLQMSAELVYSFVRDTVLRVAGPEGAQAIPFIFTMYVFILVGTLVGITPIHETFTSSLIVTLALSFTVFIYVNTIAINKFGLGFFRRFLPPGVPIFVAPILIFVELISFLFRPITLGFRIFANIFAGHVMLKLFADFCTMLIDAFGTLGVIASLVPMMVMVVLYACEVVIIFIQSYIFMLISTMYLRDALRGH